MQTLFQQSRFFRHSLFWVGMFVFILFLDFLNPGHANQGPQQTFINFCIEEFPVLLFFTYFFLYLVLPFFFKRKYAIGSLLFVASIYITGYFANFLYELHVVVITPLLSGKPPRSFCDCFFERSPLHGLIYYFVFVGMLAGGLKILLRWLQMQTENERLATEKVTTELQLLKNQLNPAFLFHTLNDLYGLTLQKSKKSPEVVLHLSNLLSYLLYESQTEEVPLTKEIAMIHDYVFLAKAHTQPTIEVSLSITGDLIGKQIPPLLLLPFIENAFKPVEVLEQAWVSVELSVAGSWLKFKIIYGTLPDLKSELHFNNSIKRLNLLYANRYNLKVLADNEVVLIRLKVPLNESPISSTSSTYETSMPISR